MTSLRWVAVLSFALSLPGLACDSPTADLGPRDASGASDAQVPADARDAALSDGAPPDLAAADAPSPPDAAAEAPAPDSPPDLVAAAPFRTCDRVSVSTAGLQTNALNYYGGVAGVHRYVSADGRFVASVSQGALVPEDTGSFTDIYLRDRQAGTTIRASVSSAGAGANGESRAPSLSDDGRYVAFESEASNLVAGDTNDVGDVFVHDRVAHTTERVSVSSDGKESNCASARPSISADGRYVAFDSCTTAWTEVAGKTLGIADIFVHDRVAHTTVLASPHTFGEGTIRWDHHSGDPVLSADGRKVAFESRSSTLADKGTPSASSEVYLHDLDAGKTEWISVHTIVAGDGSHDSGHPSLSADGRLVAYQSSSSRQVPGDGNDQVDIFVRDRMTSTTERITVTPTGGDALEVGASSCHGSQGASISADGRLVAFESCANNLVANDTGGRADIFVRDRMAGVTTRISALGDGADPDGANGVPAISADGRWVGFFSSAVALTPGEDLNGTGPDFYLCRTPAP